jgi:hypothetical protein
MENKFNKIKLYINSGIISHIYTHICDSFADFYGILLGHYKITKEIQANDINSSLEIKTLNINIDKVIFIYDNYYIKDNLDQLIEKVKYKYTEYDLIGIYYFYFYV